jgi:hypothetical protein
VEQIHDGPLLKYIKRESERSMILISEQLLLQGEPPCFHSSLCLFVLNHARKSLLAFTEFHEKFDVGSLLG